MRFRSTLSAIFIPSLVATGAFADDPSAKAKVTPPDRVIDVPADEVGRIAFSPDGKYLAAASGVKKHPEGFRNIVLHLIDVDTGKEIRRFEGHSDWITSLAFSPNGKRLVSAGADKSARVWDVASGRQEASFKCNWNYYGGGGAAFVDDNSIVVWQESTVYFLDAASGKQTRRPLGHPTAIGALAVSPKGTHLITGCGSLRYDKPWAAVGIPISCRIHVWEIATGSETQQFQFGSSPVRCVAFSPDAKWAVSGSGYSGVKRGPYCEDCFLRLWDMKQSTPFRAFAGHTNEINSVAFAPDGKFVVSGSDDRTVRIWEISTGKESYRINLERVDEGFSFEGMVRQVACSPDGKYIVACSHDRTIRFWRMPKPK